MCTSGMELAELLGRLGAVYSRIWSQVSVATDSCVKNFTTTLLILTRTLNSVSSRLLLNVPSHHGTKSCSFADSAVEMDFKIIDNYVKGSKQVYIYNGMRGCNLGFSGWYMVLFSIQTLQLLFIHLGACKFVPRGTNLP